MIRRLLPVLLTVAVVAPEAAATTARDLSERIVIDGFTGEFDAGEALFGINAAQNTFEESSADSKWGPDNDLNQIRITWDAQNLYLAGEGVIWGNNMVILIDAVPGRGLTTMRQLNAWSRNFIFTQDFAPDLFGATWDGNQSPRLLIHQGGTQVDDQQVGGELFQAAATFSTNLRGRAMELAIPWNTLFLGTEGLGTTPAVVDGDTIPTFPPGATLRICGVITAGGDNTGGPDSAPDNTRGHVEDGSQDVIIDNYAIVELDLEDDTGLGGGGPDGVADWGVDPRSRVSFKFQPPVVAVRLEIDDVILDRPAFAPDRGEALTFELRLAPPLDPADPVNAGRTAGLSANVFDLRGRFVRNLYINQQRPAADPNAGSDAFDRWDGRDESGRLVPAGVYILRCVLEPNTSRVTRPFVVVR